MATFLFNKLVRDKLKDVYVELKQRPTYRPLSDDEFKKALKNKLIEEANEIDIMNRDSVVNELADVLQVVEDLAHSFSISSADIHTIKKEKFRKKGGFSEGLFVEKLELTEDDEWNDYYRKSPDIFKEL
ncbi:MAG: nucleoside triphosphate pyrophosphohydrolase [Candidatus Microsaccharimonas sp.]